MFSLAAIRSRYITTIEARLRTRKQKVCCFVYLGHVQNVRAGVWQTRVVLMSSLLLDWRNQGRKSWLIARHRALRHDPGRDDGVIHRLVEIRD